MHNEKTVSPRSDDTLRRTTGCWRDAIPTLGWMIAFLLAVTVSAISTKHLELSWATKTLCVVVPVAFGAAMLRSAYDMIQASDELVRRMYLEALSVTAIGVWVLAFVAPILERAGVVERVDSTWYLFTIGILFLGGYFVAMRRYGL
jgi:hypothetical protein